MSFILPGYSPSKASTRNEAPIAKTIALPTINGDRIAEEFFSKQYIKKINTSNFMLYLFDLASQIQNTELRDSFSLYEIFNDDELYDVWKRKNVSAYNSYHKGGSTGVLLKRILDDADKAIANNSPCAHFRFGHESVLLPLVCRMSLNNYDKEYESAEEPSCESNTTAGPLKCHKASSTPAVFTTQPSCAILPNNTANPPSFV